MTARVHTSFGLDVFLYVALLVIFLWRQITPWQCCKRLNRYIDYIIFFYFLVLGLLICEVVQSVSAFSRIFHTAGRHEEVLAIVLLCSLPLMFIILALGWKLTRQHLNELRRNNAPSKHERAMHIIALPSVYALMAVCSFVKLYNLVGNQSSAEQKGIAFARYETCLYVGDLYEAWALYQFGKLTLELLDETFEQRQALVTGVAVQAQAVRQSIASTPFARPRQDSTRDVVLSFTAVSSLAWLGTWLLVVVCVVQAGYSIWLWCFHDPTSNWINVSADFHKFSYAGMVASGAAIYNVHTIEQTFGHLLVGYSPLLKFLSVKFLVFFAFWQTKILLFLRTIRVLPITEIEVKLLHSVLLIVECFVSSIVHIWAWGADESWYALEEQVKVGGTGSQRPTERDPLVGTGGPLRRALL